MAELVMLSIIQGITEFLPISSSAHLLIASKYFNLSNSNLTLDISLHAGSLLAIIFYFKKELKNFLKNKKLFSKIFITSIPISIFGFFLVKFNYIELLRSYKIIGWSTILFGIILFVSDLNKSNNDIKKNFTFQNVCIIGILQTLALIPGVSRSGIIISGARMLSFTRVDAAKISFLTSIPILSIVSVYNLQKIYTQNNYELSLANFISFFLSFLFSYITIKFFLNFLKKFSLSVFVIYRLILGTLILLYAYY